MPGHLLMSLSLCAQVESRSESLLPLTVGPADNTPVVVVPVSDDWSSRPVPLVLSFLEPSIVWGSEIESAFQRGLVQFVYFFDRCQDYKVAEGEKRKKNIGQKVLATTLNYTYHQKGDRYSTQKSPPVGISYTQERAQKYGQSVLQYLLRYWCHSSKNRNLLIQLLYA